MFKQFKIKLGLTGKLFSIMGGAITLLAVALTFLLLQRGQATVDTVLEEQTHQQAAIQDLQKKAFTQIREKQMIAAEASLRTKLGAITQLIGKMSTAAIASYDFGAVNEYCQDACQD
ncbi:MAG TPA: hypothetical protein VE890_13530, partial [Thermoguttaceae bacterium]|nr:hypothetical protein [Thermoguttaceae bacterium]